MVNLINPNGVEVCVPETRVAYLLTLGYTKAAQPKPRQRKAPTKGKTKER